MFAHKVKEIDLDKNKTNSNSSGTITKQTKVKTPSYSHPKKIQNKFTGEQEKITIHP